MKREWSVTLATVLGLCGAAAAQEGGQGDLPVARSIGAQSEKVSLSEAQTIIADWPAETKKNAQKVIDQYGAPDEATPSLLIWRNNGPWVMTIAQREPIAHQFPKPHTDSVEMFVAYSVPPEKFDELAAYDGSVIAERTAGLLSARCHVEAANILALNLADDIVKGEKTVQEARRAYAEAIQQSEQGEAPQIMQRLDFEQKALRLTRDQDQQSQPSGAGKKGR